MRAVISTSDLNPESLVAKARQIPSMAGSDLVQYVTTKKPYFWKYNQPDYVPAETLSNSFVWRHRGKKHSVVALDFGIKYNIVRCLENAGCEVLTLPWQKHLLMSSKRSSRTVCFCPTVRRSGAVDLCRGHHPHASGNPAGFRDLSGHAAFGTGHGRENP